MAFHKTVDDVEVLYKSIPAKASKDKVFEVLHQIRNIIMDSPGLRNGKERISYWDSVMPTTLKSRYLTPVQLKGLGLL